MPDALNVLLLESDNVQAEAFTKMLAASTSTELEVTRVQRVSTALSRLRDGGIDVILADLALPNMSGVDVLTELFAAVPQIPIIVLTSLDDKDLALAALECGAQDYLIKERIDQGVLDRCIKYGVKRREAMWNELKEEAYEQQQEKMESLSKFARGIAEDFNNLITNISCNASLAVMNLPEGSPVAHHLQLVENMSEQAAELVKKLFTYAGKADAETEDVDLSKLVESVVASLAASVPRTITLTQRLRPNLQMVDADAGQMREAVEILFHNAVEIMGQASGEVIVSTGMRECAREFLATNHLGRGLPSGRYAFIEVTDTGPGMPPATLNKIFDPFFSTKEGGRGLGLAVLQGIVQRYRGCIHVVSTPGRGSSFQILFPSRARQTTPAAKAPEPIAWTGSGLVLVMDREANLRSTVKRVLESFGFTVVTAATGAEGIETFSELNGEIVLTMVDLDMPDMSGEEVFIDLWRRNPQAPVLLSSSYEEADIMTRLSVGGFAGLLQKPYQPQILVDKVREVLGA